MLLALVFSLLLLVYAYIGYPLLIALLARYFPLRLQTASRASPMVSVLIPVYNGGDFVARKIDSLLAQDYPRDKLELLLCSDASNDGTDKVLVDYAARFPGIVRNFRMEERSGKPLILNFLRKEARGEVLLMTDIRQPLEKNCIEVLVTKLASHNVAVVGGMLLLRGRTGAGFYWKYEKWIRQCESDFRSVTGVSGSLYVIYAEDMPELPRDIILDDVWVPSVQRLRGKRVILAPEAVAWDDAMDDEQEFGRKVRTLAGNYQLLVRLPALLSPFHNPSWFEFISHKVVRLLCPWALLVLLLSNIVLLQEVEGMMAYGMMALLGGQLLFYLLAALGKKAGAPGKLARTFVILNFAAVVGLWRYMLGRQKIAW